MPKKQGKGPVKARADQAKLRQKAAQGKSGDLLGGKPDEELVGLRCEVWWDGEDQFFRGDIVQYDAERRTFSVDYDDGDQDAALEILEFEIDSKKQPSVVRVLKSRTEDTEYLVKEPSPEGGSEPAEQQAEAQSESNVEASAEEQTAAAPAPVTDSSPAAAATSPCTAIAGEPSEPLQECVLEGRAVEEQGSAEDTAEVVALCSSPRPVALAAEDPCRTSPTASCSPIGMTLDYSPAQPITASPTASMTARAAKEPTCVPESCTTIRDEDFRQSGNTAAVELCVGLARWVNHPLWQSAQWTAGSVPLHGRLSWPFPTLLPQRNILPANAALDSSLPPYQAPAVAERQGSEELGLQPRDMLPKPITLPPPIDMKLLPGARPQSDPQQKRKHRLSEVSRPDADPEADPQSTLEQQSQLAAAHLANSVQTLQLPSAEQVALVRQKAEAAAKAQNLRLEKIKADQKAGRGSSIPRSRSRSRERRSESRLREGPAVNGRARSSREPSTKSHDRPELTEAERKRYEAVKRDAAARRLRDSQVASRWESGSGRYNHARLSRDNDTDSERGESEDRYRTRRNHSRSHLDDHSPAPSRATDSSAERPRDEDRGLRANGDAKGRRSLRERHRTEPSEPRNDGKERREAFREREKPELRHPDDLQPPSRRFKRGRVFVCSATELEDCIRRDVVGGSRPSDAEEVCERTAIFLCCSGTNRMAGIYCGDEERHAEDCRRGPFRYQVPMRLWRPGGTISVSAAQHAIGKHPSPHSRCPVPDMLSENQVKALCREFRIAAAAKRASTDRA